MSRALLLLPALFATPFVVLTYADTVVPQWAFATSSALPAAAMALIARAYRRQPARRAPWGLVAWAAVAACSVLWLSPWRAGDPRPWKWALLALGQLLGLLAAYTAARATLTDRAWRTGMVLVGLGMAALIGLEWAGWTPWGWNPGLSPGGTMGNRSWAGYVCALAGAWAGPLPAALLLAGALATYSYSAILLGVLATPLLRWRAKAIAAGIVLAVIAGRWGFGLAEGSVEGRLVMWQQAGRMFAARPLYGWGAGSYVDTVDRGEVGRAIFVAPHARRIAYRAHCEPLQIAAELGLAGLLPALAFFAPRLWRAWRAGGRTRNYTAAMAALMLIGFPLQLAPIGLPLLAWLGIRDRSRETGDTRP